MSIKNRKNTRIVIIREGYGSEYRVLINGKEYKLWFGGYSYDRLLCWMIDHDMFLEESTGLEIFEYFESLCDLSDKSLGVLYDSNWGI